MTLHAIGNAHIDPVWLWPWNEGLETIRATFRSALDLLEEYPDFIFTASSAAFYYLLEQVEPQMLDEIKEQVEQGRWEIAGGWWVEPDVNIPSGESLVRQQLQGQLYFRRTFGKTADVGFNPDTFGHCGELPQILNGGGILYYCFLRPGPHEKELPGPVFRWRSSGGGQVLASRIAESYTSWFDTPEQLEEVVQANHRARPDYLSDFTLYYGVGNHGGGPTRRNLDLIRERKEREPKVALSSPGRYFASVAAELRNRPPDAVPVVRGELQHHAPGCYSAHSEIKRENRRCEHALITAEKLATMAHVLAGRAYPREKLTEAWRLLLFNQFHDILAGTSLPIAYRDARDQIGHAASIASEATHFSLQSIARNIDTRGEGDALVIFNPLAMWVKAAVELEPAPESVSTNPGSPLVYQHIQPTNVTGSRRAVFVIDLPPLGWRVLRQNVQGGEKPAAPKGNLKASGRTIENDLFSIESDDSGALQVFDGRTGEQLLRSPGIQAVVLDDPTDTWSHGVGRLGSEIGRFGNASIQVEEDGPVRACLRVESTWGSSSLVQRVYLYRELEFIEFRVTLNWQEQYKALKLSFPVDLDDPEVVYETPYGHEVREPTGVEEPGQQWVCVQGKRYDKQIGLALLNDSKYGFDALGSELRMTVARSPAYAHHDPAKLDPDLRYPHLDQGIQEFRCRLIPFEGAWQDADIPQCAYELNVPPITLNEYAHEGRFGQKRSFLQCESDDAIITAVKLAEGSDDVVVRGYDSGGDGCEARIRLPDLGVSWAEVFHPGQIKSWMVMGDGVVYETDLLEEPISTDPVPDRGSTGW